MPLLISYCVVPLTYINTSCIQSTCFQEFKSYLDSPHHLVLALQLVKVLACVRVCIWSDICSRKFIVHYLTSEVQTPCAGVFYDGLKCLHQNNKYPLISKHFLVQVVCSDMNYQYLLMCCAIYPSV